MIVIRDKKYHYISAFNPENGQGIRSNVYDEDMKDTGIDPFMGSFPELLDVGIMGSCAHGKSGLCLMSGVQCYQDGMNLSQPDMTLEEYKRIIDQCRGRSFQVALGGRGDPDMHKDIIEILKYSRENNVVPNFTTSGFGLREELMPYIKQYCGAVAVSWYRNEYTQRAIAMFLSAGIRTNIHYCLSRSTIDEAIAMVENRKYPEGINRIIFLLHKPVGLGTEANVLQADDERVRRFFSLFNDASIADKAGFDSCSVPALLWCADKIRPECIEACEAGRFSAYISPDYRLYPCSFEKNPYFGLSLKDMSIEEAWNSDKFNEFRGRFKNRCHDCPKYKSCFGGCPVVPQITLCDNDFRKGAIV
jgi:radical SAM protein with 4Fe4S-binding SPASM domain